MRVPQMPQTIRPCSSAGPSRGGLARRSAPRAAASSARRAWLTLLANSGSCCEGEFEAGEVAGAGAVQGVAVPPGVQADEVEGDRCVDVFEVGFGQAAVAGLAGAGDGDGLMDGAFDTGAEAILGLPAGAV